MERKRDGRMKKERERESDKTRGLLAAQNTNDEGSFYFIRPTRTFAAMIATPLIKPTAAALN